MGFGVGGGYGSEGGLVGALGFVGDGEALREFLIHN